MSDARTQKAGVAVRVSAILSQFWTEDSPDDVRAMELEGWLDVLGGVTTDELRAAWADYQITAPRSGASARLARPDAGALMLRVNKARKLKRDLAPPVRIQLSAPKPAPRMTPERMAEIMRETGYHGTVEVKPFPAVGEGNA